MEPYWTGALSQCLTGAGPSIAKWELAAGGLGRRTGAKSAYETQVRTTLRQEMSASLEDCRAQGDVPGTLVDVLPHSMCIAPASLKKLGWAKRKTLTRAEPPALFELREIA